MPKLLTNTEITKRFESLEFNWKHVAVSLKLEVETKDFAEAMWVANEIAQVAEELNHHPDIYLHDYNKLDITTSTHSQNGITEKDFTLAERVEGIVTRIKN